MRQAVLSLAVLPLLLATVLPVQAATLAWKFTPGDVQHYRLTQSSTLTSSSLDEDEQLAAVEQVLELTWKVLEASDSGSAKISLEITALSLLAKGPDGQEVEYDSTSAEEPQGYAAMLAPIGKRLAESPLEFTMNSRGDVTDLELPAALAEAVKVVPGGKKYSQDGGLASIETLARLGAPLDMPEGDVTANQTWSTKRRIELPVLGATSVSFTYKVADPAAEDEVTIGQHMSIAGEGDEQVAKFNNQESTGTVVFDVKNGRPETSVLSYTVEIEQPKSSGVPLKLELNTEFRRIADETQ